MKGLFPEFRKAGKKHQVETIKVGELWSLDLSIKHDQLLAQAGLYAHLYETQFRSERETE